MAKHVFLEFTMPCSRIYKQNYCQDTVNIVTFSSSVFSMAPSSFNWVIALVVACKQSNAFKQGKKSKSVHNYLNTFT